ncbi:MAG: NAD(P)/FAD-dependent oxidoreductase [Planctomycetota bacterium]
MSSDAPAEVRPRVAVVGAGFAGLHVARGLAKAPVEVTILDRANHHLFQPLLYQVATATLSPDQIAHPIRAVFRKQENARTLLADAQAVDLEQGRLSLAREDGGVDHLDFDYLVVATGVTHSYFGHDEWAEHAPGLKSLEDALEIRRRVLRAFELAERNPADADSLLTFVVVGAGPTGVELAGALAEIARKSLRREFRSIDPTSARILLVEGGGRVLPAYVERLSESAKQQLESLGVEVHIGAQVTQVDAEGVVVRMGDLDTKERIESQTVLWAAGVRGSSFADKLGVELDRSGRVPVTADLSLEGHPGVFVAGDLAVIDGESGQVPGVAPAAIQAGKHIARQIGRELEGRSREPFRYRDRGSLATIGWARAVADLRIVRFTGVTAWFAWMAIHVAFLVGFRNRLFVLLGWAWSYVTFRRGARLITKPEADEPLS